MNNPALNRAVIHLKATLRRGHFQCLLGHIAVLCMAFQQSLPFQETRDTPRDAFAQLGELGAGWCLHPAELDPSIGTLDIHAIGEQQILSLCHLFLRTNLLSFTVNR